MKAPNTKASLEVFLHKTVHGLLVIAEAAGGDAFRSIFCGGVIANVVANLSEEDWKAFITVNPCGVAGCDCHLKQSNVIRAMTDLREDHKEHCPQMIAE